MATTTDPGILERIAFRLRTDTEIVDYYGSIFDMLSTRKKGTQPIYRFTTKSRSTPVASDAPASKKCRIHLRRHKTP